MAGVRDRFLAWGGLLQQPDFRRLWLAQSISQVGTQITLLALPLVAIVVVGASPLAVAVLGAIELAPFLLFTLPAGAWVDRLPRRQILVATNLGRAVVLAAVPASYLTGWLDMWMLYVVAFAVGAQTVFFDVAYQSFLPELVPRERLAEANSRLEVTRSLAQILGPGLAGVLIGLLTAPLAILADAVSFLASAAFLFGIRRQVTRPTLPLLGPQASQPASLRRQIGEGLVYVLRHPWLRAITGGAVTLNLAGQIGWSVQLVFVVRELGLSAEAIGLTVAVGGSGTLFGAAMADVVGRRLGIGRALFGAFVTTSASILIVAFAPRQGAIPFLIVASLLQGAAVMVANVNALSFRQALTPDHLLGRVNATVRWVAWGAIPIGSVAGGVLATAIGLRLTMAISGLLAMSAALWPLFSPLWRLRQVPGQPRAAAG